MNSETSSASAGGNLPASLQHKLDGLLERHQEVAALLSEPDAAKDGDRFRDLSREYAELDDIAGCYQRYLHAQDARLQTSELLEELRGQDEAELRTLAEEELAQGDADLETIGAELRAWLLPKDPDDRANVFLEIRAGTGGDEAALFAGDLHRMYLRYAESARWQVEVLSASVGEHGGYREVVTRISGHEVFARLKFESGVHRVQRVPETESQGRIHTSACTVAILPEVADVDEVKIAKEDLRVDTFRASGAGGQHVNKTDSAVRLTHLPTGLVVECQDERSQHRNRERAMSLLSARLTNQAREAQQAEQASTRRSLIGSGDRSERIRTYNFPQGRVTDHRINLTLYRLDDVVQGDLDPLLTPLIQEHQADLLAALRDQDGSTR